MEGLPPGVNVQHTVLLLNSVFGDHPVTYTFLVWSGAQHEFGDAKETFHSYQERRELTIAIAAESDMLPESHVEMMKFFRLRNVACLLILPSWVFAADRVKTANGIVETTKQPKDGVRSFKGIPFAAPPVGDLRWRAPQPVKNWAGVRKADDFGARCMQHMGPNADYWFRSNGMSEDCLYLNVWTPAKSNKEMLPVLVYVFGGGFQNGDGSEPRYDGQSTARNGIVAVSLNYRINIFGFFSHPELTKESTHHASGNYGLLDQVAALEWVQKNIAAFGGDPKRVTVAGESAGSISVSALMASPLSRDLMAGAIGESGALISTLPPRPLSQTEKEGARFGELAGAGSLKDLRAMSADKIEEVVAKVAPTGGGAPGSSTAPALRFSANLDGYFLPKTPLEIFEAGEEAKVPLLAGSNSQEMAGRLNSGPERTDRREFCGGDSQALWGQGGRSIESVCAKE